MDGSEIRKLSVCYGGHFRLIIILIIHNCIVIRIKRRFQISAQSAIGNWMKFNLQDLRSKYFRPPDMYLTVFTICNLRRFKTYLLWKLSKYFSEIYVTRKFQVRVSDSLILARFTNLPENYDVLVENIILKHTNNLLTRTQFSSKQKI